MSASALLLAAGRATRLGPLRERWAKACAPVAGTSPLAFLLPRLAAAGVERIWINLHHHAEQVRDLARALAPPGVELHFLEEPELLGTGGSLLAVAARDGGLPELVVNAKIFTDFRFERLLAAPAAALVLHPPSDLREFGGLRHEAGRVTGLLPRAAAAAAGVAGAAVFAGIARPDPAWLLLLAAAPAGRPRCLIRDGVLPALAAGRAPAALLHDGFWCEISTPERLAAAAEELRQRGLAPPLNQAAPADRPGSGSARAAP